MIPYPYNPNFFGRASELQFIRDKLSPESYIGSTKILALYGTAGIGKTAIATAIAYEEKVNRQIVIWVTANDSSKLSERFVEAAYKMGIHQPGANAAADRKAVVEWLARSSRCLSASESLEHSSNI